MRAAGRRVGTGAAGLRGRWSGLAPLAAAGLLLLAARPAGAYFEQDDVGARAAGFARAFTAIADDASAIYWNPAGLAGMDRVEIDLTYSRPYNIPGFSADFGAVALPLGFVTAGAAWYHVGVSGAINEDTFTLGAGRDVFISPRGIRLALGGAVKAARVSFPAYVGPDFEPVDFGSATKLTGDLAALVRFPNRMSVGAVVQNLGSPDFNLVSGEAGGTDLPMAARFGAAYQWNLESTVSVDYRHVDGERNILNFGGEIWFYRSFAIRAGINDRAAGGGVSIKSSRWLIDLAFLTNQPLGISYRAGLRIPL